jgi:hypothetical protein
MKVARLVSSALLVVIASLLAYGYFSVPAAKVMGVYDNEPRLGDGHVDVPALISAIKDSNANTYNYLIGHETTDWEDLPGFLDAAEREGIDVWVTVLPPSESPPFGSMSSEPYGLDFVSWARAIANLSASHKSLKAWSVDNLDHNCGFFAPQYLEEAVSAGKEVNPDLAFVPVVYYPALNMPQCSHIFEQSDGLQFYYRHESGIPDVSSTDTLASEIEAFKARFRKPLVLGVYASCLAQNACPTADYVGRVMRASQGRVDGWMVYTLQPEKESFGPARDFFDRARQPGG